jgi:hypothetical protein
MLLNSPIHRSISPSDINLQQRSRHRHSHHHRHSTAATRRTQTANPAITTEEQTSDSNTNHL